MQGSTDQPTSKKRRMSLGRLGIALCLGLIALPVLPGPCAHAADLTALSLEELMALDVTVTSPARRPQRLGDTASAAFVLTATDMRQAGVWTIPDALRLVPGVQVARIDASKWAVSVRGFNNRFSNKALVLIDGRTVYNPIFSGVLWNAQEVLFEDIDRIEVIRGPGASLWGANAVNGVINIITKPAAETHGTYVSAGAGTEERRVAARQGMALDPDGDGDSSLRVYGVHRTVDPGWLDHDGERADDAWWSNRAGYRADLGLSGTGDLTVQGDLFTATAGNYLTTRRTAPPFDVVPVEETEIFGGNMLARWTRDMDSAGTLTAQAYYDHLALRSPLTDVTTQTADIETKHTFSPLDGHTVVWGAGYRFVRTTTEGTPALGFEPSDHSDHIFNAFLQDDIALIADTLSLTLGTKVEYFSHSGLAVEPTARLLWTPHAQHSVWASVSRAVRTPSIANRALSSTRLEPTPFGVPMRVTVSGNEDINPEVLWAYEAGYRFRPQPTLSFDLAAYYNVYDDLVSYELGAPRPTPAGLVAVGATGNRVDGTAYGLELAAEWQPRDWVSVNAWFSVQEIDLNADRRPGEVIQNLIWDGTSPALQGGLRAAFRPRDDLEAGLTLRAADAIDSIGADAYVDVDARLAWQPTDAVELAVIGRNLLTDHRQEFPQHREVATDTDADIGRSVFATLSVRF